MTDRKPFLRHLPPTALRVRRRDLWLGISASLNKNGAINQFRSTLIEQTGVSHCYPVSSGRAGLALILIALKKMSGRTKVAVPAYVCPTVVQSVIKAGLEPVFCDMDVETLDLDRRALERIIDSDLLAVVPVHLYGWAQDIRDIIELGNKHGFFVIEDAAQAYGAKLAGRMVGTWGDAGYYSLGRGKCIPVGHGGVIVTGEQFAPELAALIDSVNLPSPGFDLSTLVLFFGYGFATHPAGWWFVARTSLNPAEEGMEIENLPPIAINSLSPAQAGIGSSILTRISQAQAISVKNAQKLMELLSEFEFLRIPAISPEAEPVFLRLPIILDDKLLADKVFDGLSRVGIGVSRSYSRTIPDLYAKEFPSDGKEFPGADRLAACLLTLPTHAYLLEEDMDRIFHVLNRMDH